MGKRGTFLKNRSNTKLRPVRRIHSNATTSCDDFLPCPHCLGFYKRKSLYRHSKNCGNQEVEKGKRQNAQSNGQTALLMGTLLKHKLLKEELFPRMRADNITLTAKKDSLICNYGYSYMKGRRSKGNLDLVRQNMRRLAKLLLYTKEETSEITKLTDLLRPTMFQTIINGVNKIGGYNPDTNFYESPTVAINFGTLIKKCCDLAYIDFVQKPNTEQQRKDIKILKALVESQWANEVSAHALSDLNSKTWNKEQLLPLTSDLKKLKTYLEKSAEESIQMLTMNKNDQSAYNTLKEILYCQVILMNRRRPAEVSQIKVQTYRSINLENQENEFESCLTETEKILLNSCSRIVIRGKRGRGVPILLSQKMREHFDFLVKIRDNFIENNDFVFHTSGKTFIDGTKILYKHAKKCGVENPKSISATRLRKHLATVTQLLEFSKSDLEQLSKFMGHTLKTHCDFYRLSDNMYQTAKISKLLLLASEGGLEKYKGKHLDEIDIDLNPVSEDWPVEEQIQEINPDNTLQPKSENVYKFSEPEEDLSYKPTLKKPPHKRQPWTQSEKKIMSNYFAKHIESKRAPKEHEINTFVEEYPRFKGRKWSSIKAVVFNIYTKKIKIPLEYPKLDYVI